MHQLVLDGVDHLDIFAIANFLLYNLGAFTSERHCWSYRPYTGWFRGAGRDLYYRAATSNIPWRYFGGFDWLSSVLLPCALSGFICNLLNFRESGQKYAIS